MLLIIDLINLEIFDQKIAFIFLAFEPSHSQAHSLSLSGKVLNYSCRRGAFFPPVYFFNILFRLEVSSLLFFF